MSVLVSPNPFEMDQREEFNITFDVSSWLAPEDAIGAGASELVRITDGVSYTAGLSGSPVVVGQTIGQEVHNLEAGERYWLILPFSSNGRIFAPRLQITVPPL